MNGIRSEQQEIFIIAISFRRFRVPTLSERNSEENDKANETREEKISGNIFHSNCSYRRDVGNFRKKTLPKQRQRCKRDL